MVVVLVYCLSKLLILLCLCCLAKDLLQNPQNRLHNPAVYVTSQFKYTVVFESMLSQ